MDPVTAILLGFGVTNLNLTLMSMAASEKKDAENQNLNNQKGQYDQKYDDSPGYTDGIGDF